MAIAAREIEPLREQETQSPRLLWLPTVYPFEVFKHNLPTEGEVSARVDYWHKAEKFLAPAMNYKGTVRLYLEGIYPELLGGGITSPTHVSFDQNYPEFERLVDWMKRERQTPGNFDQWNIVLAILERRGNTWIEVCDYGQRCLRLEVIEQEIMQETDKHRKEILQRAHRKELGEFGRERRRDFEARVKATLKPGELGVLLLGVNDFSVPGVKIELPFIEGSNAASVPPSSASLASREGILGKV